MSGLPGTVTVPMLTTITVNGSEGLRFLSTFSATFPGPIPPILATIVDHAAVARPNDLVSLEVEPSLAEEVAAFVDHLIRSQQSGEFCDPPLLFSAHAGDLVVVVRDALVEIHTDKPRTWRFVARGTRGRLVARRGDCGKVLLIDSPRDHAYLSDRSMTRVRAIVPQLPRTTARTTG